MRLRPICHDWKLVDSTGRGLAVSWALCAVCIFGHLTYFFGTKAPWIHALHSTGFHLSLCLFTLLGPGRQLLVDGLRSLVRGAPNMNTLVGLGALSSFAVSSLAAFIPKLVICYSILLHRFLNRNEWILKPTTSFLLC